MCDAVREPLEQFDDVLRGPIELLKPADGMVKLVRTLAFGDAISDKILEIFREGFPLGGPLSAPICVFAMRAAVRLLCGRERYA
jgi:hypothetical protein